MPIFETRIYARVLSESRGKWEAGRSAGPAEHSVGALPSLPQPARSHDACAICLGLLSAAAVIPVITVAFLGDLAKDIRGFTGLDLAIEAPGVPQRGEHRVHCRIVERYTLKLPTLDGYEATRQIRAIDELKSVPIIAVTSYALSGDEARARSAGCDTHVAKPFSPRELLAKVHEFLLNKG